MLNSNSNVFSILNIVSDSYFFWLVQTLLLLIMIILITIDILLRNRSGKGGVNHAAGRSEKSMKLYYAIYASTNGLLVALCLSAKVPENYRMFLILFDTACCYYIFVYSQFVRDKILILTESLTKEVR